MSPKNAFIKRNITKKLATYLDFFPVVAIIGPRQVGKTALTKAQYPNWTYIDLENPNDYDRIQHDAILFFTQHPNHVIIDEAQLLPDLFKTLRHIIDDNRDQKGRFIITGSSSPELLENISESLAGRIGILRLDQLKCNEVEGHPLSSLYDGFASPKLTLPSGLAPISNTAIQAHWLTGGYPEPKKLNRPDFHTQWMAQYIDTYIFRDLAKLFPKLNKVAYRRFFTMLTNLSGTIINRSDLGRSVEMDEKTIRNYLDIAAGTFMWQALQSYETDIIKSTIKLPTGYLTDTGLLHHLLRLHQLDDLYTHPKIGLLFEGYVVNELLRGLRVSMQTQWQMHYYRTRSGQEVDIILQCQAGIIPIEVKYASYTSPKKLQHLTKFIQDHDVPFGIVINQSTTAEWLTNTIFQLPVGFL